MDNLETLQKQIGYIFKDTELLKLALTHRSFCVPHNERLEFLGDSILNFVIATILYDRFPHLDEGSLSRLRSHLVRQQMLFELAQKIELSRYLRLGEGELKAGGTERPSILADAMEALFGAIFLDNHFDVVLQVIGQLFKEPIDQMNPQIAGKDAKTQLQEYLQGHKLALPEYQVIATHGAAHNQTFEVACEIKKLAIRVLGSGNSRRAAEQEAAQKALNEIQQKK